MTVRQTSILGAMKVQLQGAESCCKKKDSQSFSSGGSGGILAQTWSLQILHVGKVVLWKRVFQKGPCSREWRLLEIPSIPQTVAKQGEC